MPTRMDTMQEQDSVEAMESNKETSPLLNDEPSLDQSDQHKNKDFQLVGVPNQSRAPLFSFRKLWAFTGPGFLMSIAYLDPGNIESDLQAGAIVQYKLLWVLMWSTVAGLLMQLLAVRLGVVTGKHLADVCKDEYPFVPRIVLWLAMEIAIISSDIQEVIGSAIAIYIISQKTIPLWEGCLITGVDTFTFLFLESYGLRYLELFFGLLISVMCGMFGYMYIYAAPNQLAVVSGVFLPLCQNCTSTAVDQGLGLVGAVIMPHNIYLHSGLVLSRAIKRSNDVEVKEGLKYFTIESTIALLISFVINLFVIGVFGASIYNGQYGPNDHCSPDSISLQTAGYCLSEYYNQEWILYVWAVGILASGQSSTMTGTYAGQFVMEGFLGLKWAKWKRVLLTRSIAMVPCVVLAAVAVSRLDILDEFINVGQSILLPFSVLPILYATSSKRIMKQHRANKIFMVIVWLISLVVMGVNVYFIIDQVVLRGPLYQHILGAIGLVAYLAIVGFFIIYPLVREIRLYLREKRMNLPPQIVEENNKNDSQTIQ